MKHAKRLDLVPPYLFADLERKIDDKRRQGVDVISLGIGDPDLPTPGAIVEEMQRQVARPETQGYPSNRGLAAFREAVAGFYAERFGVELDPEREVIPALGGKEAVAHVALALLD
ncbi:MAG: aminotransferase class I/II-fold pyridoxal phosphate-dependent enzyme, partial [Gaiellaceae bacterium]